MFEQLAPKLATWMPVIQGLISSLGPLFGVWLGSRLARGNIERQWARDQRLKFYMQALEALSRFSVEMEHLVGRKDLITGGEMKELAIANGKPMETVFGSADLFCSPPVHQELSEVIYSVRELVGASSNRVSYPEWCGIEAKLGRKRDSLVDIIRTELSLSKPQRSWRPPWIRFRLPRFRRKPIDDFDF